MYVYTYCTYIVCLYLCFCLLESVTSETAPSKPSTTDSATRLVDISRLDIRVGKVLSVEKVCICYVCKGILIRAQNN